MCSSTVEDQLSLSDIIMPYVYTRVILVYDYLIEDLEQSFNEYLHRFCPQAFKRIINDDCERTRGHIVDYENGQKRQVFSRESRSDESITKYLSDDSLNDDVFPCGMIPTDVSPLIFMHQISLQDGSLLAIGCHHYLSDGHGLSILGLRFSQWLKDKHSLAFDHDRSKLQQLASLSSIRYEHSEMSLAIPIIPGLYKWPLLDTVVKRYTKNYLFDRLNVTNNNGILSMNDVLMGWLTKIISQIRQVSRQTTVKIGMALNGRTLLPNIDVNYFALAFIDKHHRSSLIHLGWQPIGGNDLSFSNWTRFPIYKCDFGQGRAKNFKFSSMECDGLIFILPTMTDDEIELHITLQAEHAKLLLSKLV
ncbi:unnamed protein product [Rotaria socialis]